MYLAHALNVKNTQSVKKRSIKLSNKIYTFFVFTKKSLIQGLLSYDLIAVTLISTLNSFVGENYVQTVSYPIFQNISYML